MRALGTDYQPLAAAKLDVSVARIPTVLDVASTARPEPVAAQHGVTDEDGELTFELPPPAPGGYRITARATLAGRPVEEDEVFLVRGAGRELEEPEARDDLLRAVASVSGGSFRGPGASLDGLTLLAAAGRPCQPAPRRRNLEPLVDARRRCGLPRAQLGAAPPLGLRIAGRKADPASFYGIG